MRRIAFFYQGTRQSALDTGRYEAFVQGLRDVGLVEGRQIAIDVYYADGFRERLPNLAAEVLRSKVDVIVATGGPVYTALREAKAAVPVVVTVGPDPVAAGLAASIARPGGIFTGLTDAAETLVPKQLELLQATLPRLSRIGVFINPINVNSHRRQAERLAAAGRESGVGVVRAEVGTVAQIEPGLASLAKDRADAVVLFGDTLFVQWFARIAHAAIEHRLPSIAVTPQYPEASGLMSYGADITDNFRRAATYVDRILKGAKPAELPFEHPSKYLLAINLKTAKALGLDVPQSLVLRADLVIR